MRSSVLICRSVPVAADTAAVYETLRSVGHGFIIGSCDEFVNLLCGGNELRATETQPNYNICVVQKGIIECLCLLNVEICYIKVFLCHKTVSL